VSPSTPTPPGAHLPEHPEFLWRTPEPKKHYDVVIVGGGGHGLATAHYLAKNHGITNVAVLERGWLAGGNMARNTTLIRSNYLWDESSRIYEHALKLWEGLEEDLGYPIMFSQRGVLNLAHSLQDVRDSVRRVEANKLNGIDAQWIEPDEVKKLCPIINISNDVRYPVLGATYQPRAGIAKHDYVAWGIRSPGRRGGIDIIQNCEVIGFDTDGDRVTGVRTTRGTIGAGRVALCAAGHTSMLTDMLGIRTPLQSHPLQALVSELLEPVHPTIVMSNAVHVYVSQAHKGELVMGAGIDSYNGYGQRGAFHIIERQMAAAVELFPVFARRAPTAYLGGESSMSVPTPPHCRPAPVTRTSSSTPDGAPAASRPHRASGGALPTRSPTTRSTNTSAPFSLDRFVTGALVDEHGAAGVAH
jgi:sarcosine oxidase subunit beta